MGCRPAIIEENLKGGNGSPVAIINASRIARTVNLISPDSFVSSNDAFVDTGGTVRRDRLSGSDDMVVVDLASERTRPLTGGIDTDASYPGLAPPSEPAIDRVPIAVYWRHVAPRRTG